MPRGCLNTVATAPRCQKVHVLTEGACRRCMQCGVTAVSMPHTTSSAQQASASSGLCRQGQSSCVTTVSVTVHNCESDGECVTRNSN